MEKIDHILQHRGSLKAVRREQGIGKYKMYALRDKEGNATATMDKIAKVAEEFYSDLYSSRDD